MTPIENKKLNLDSNQKNTLNNLKRRKQIIMPKNGLIKLLFIFLGTLFAIALSIGLSYIFFKLNFDVLIFLCMVFVVAVVLACLFVYISNTSAKIFYDVHQFMAICFCIFLGFTINLYVSNFSLLANLSNTIPIYIMPIAIVAFLTAPIAEKKDAFLANIVTILMILSVVLLNSVYNKVNIFALTAVCISGLMCGSLVAYRIASTTARIGYIVRGFFYCVVSFVVLFVIELLYSGSIHHVSEELQGVWYYIIISPLVSIILGLVLQPILEQVFNILSNTRLTEMTDHNQKLVKQLMQTAPGTFNHSVTVANFAEICAKAIGENPYMARACAYYHDMGKMVNPLYFKENQKDINPHDEMLPEYSSEIIRNHTIDGFKLCRSARIPERVAEVTVQHHGTLPIAVFYNKAKQLTDSEVDIENYKYKGDTPKTKIAAIIMICDASEAAIRSMSNSNGEKVNALLTSLINDRIFSGQFSNCPITMQELDIIKMTIVNIYGGAFHSRIAYPSGDNVKK